MDYNIPSYIEKSKISSSRKKASLKIIGGLPTYISEEDPIVIRIFHPVRSQTREEFNVDLPGAVLPKESTFSPDMPEIGKVYPPDQKPQRLKRIPVDPDVWTAVGLPTHYAPKTMTLRQKIALAGRNLMKIELTYIKADLTGSGEEGMVKKYVLEPYAYRRKVVKKRGGRKEYFFGYDNNDGTIKCYLVEGMLNVDILPYDLYTARWVVEV